jgi:predicted transposase YdaD
MQVQAKSEDKQMYDQREKAQRDYEWALSGARAQGREEGREEGEQLGVVKGQIQLLQELLGETPAALAELQALDIAALSAKLAELQQRLRKRR